MLKYEIRCFTIKVRLSPSQKLVLFTSLKALDEKNDEKCFLFHLKSSIHSQDICIFVLTFWSCREKD